MFAVLAGGLATVGGACVALRSAANRLAFHAPKSKLVADGRAFSIGQVQVLRLESKEGDVHPEGKTLYFHCHGNAGSIELGWNKHLERLQQRIGDRTGVFATFDYRGFGKSIGRPTLENACQDAAQVLTTLDAMHRPSNIVLLGTSLGAWVSTNLDLPTSVRDKITHVRLCVPFLGPSTLRSLGALGLPNKLLGADLGSLSKVPDIEVTLAEQDVIVANQQIRRLVQTHWPHAKIVQVPNTTHTSIDWAPGGFF